VARLLLASNAKRDGMGYLEHAQEELRDFYGGEVERVLFVPYAAITKSYETYVGDIAPVFHNALGCEIVAAHTLADPVAAVAEVDAVVVGGGNTWMLHRQMRQLGLIDAIRDRVLAGTPYMGWSAGSNMACPTSTSRVCARR
jgi:dipeptidase E